ncbi:hypothetical protein [Pseudomonas gozinkensis]|uniref:hypothetical protein n=1 Tax=Pseudomonas gozinkensis TaxID=2774461 RepID=UPI0017886364|nr:hypothetical protein [Pseudomonas gozinkensis]
MKRTKNDNNNNTELPHDENNATTAPCGDESFFHGFFNPPHHYMGREFTADEFVFASLTPEYISTLGYRFAGIQPKESIRFLIPRYLPNGNYPIDNSNPALPQARLSTNGGTIYSGKDGFFEFTLDRASSIIEAKFHLTVLTEGKEYPLKGELKLNATGPI